MRAGCCSATSALADGAVGLSSGLDYLPSRFGAAGEIADIARPLAGAERPYVSHLRAYGADVGSGLDELVAVGRGAGVRAHASHLWGSPAAIEAAFRAADAAGVGVSYDMYPYRRSSTILASLLLPPDLRARGFAVTTGAIHLLGDAASPWLIGIASDAVGLTAPVLVTADPGCLMHLRGRTEKTGGPRVVHLATALARGVDAA